MQSNDSKGKKTWGREIATFVLLWFMFYIVPMKDIEYVKILVLPVFSLWTLAYGLKRITNDTGLLGTSGPTYGGRPQHSGEYTTGQGEYSDHREFNPEQVRPPEYNTPGEYQTPSQTNPSRTSPEPDK